MSDHLLGCLMAIVISPPTKADFYSITTPRCLSLFLPALHPANTSDTESKEPTTINCFSIFSSLFLLILFSKLDKLTYITKILPLVEIFFLSDLNGLFLL